MTYTEIANRLLHLQAVIIKKKDCICSILEKTETRKTAMSEIEKVITCIDNIDKQIYYLCKPELFSLSVYLPLNQPLYSLFLFVIIPGCRFKKTFFRPPQLLSTVYQELYDTLELIDYHIYCQKESRRIFTDEKAAHSDCVIYTGQYNNSIEVQQLLSPNTIFIFQGSGANPIIISEKATISDYEIEKIINAQIYNSGQDCMAPSAIFVPESDKERFLSLLVKKIQSLVVGDYTDDKTDIARLIDHETLNNVQKTLNSTNTTLLYGGQLDYVAQIIHPCIIEYDNILDVPTESSFAPVFSLYFYNTSDDIHKYLSRPDYQENKAYISIFGDFDPGRENGILIKNDILDSIDNGYSEFGGYGIRSGFISFSGLTTSKPLLISKELSMFCKINNSIVPSGNADEPLFESFIASSLIDLSTRRVLEVGCGLLSHAKILSSHCISYNAIDTNPKILSSINRTPLNDNLHYANMDACHTQYKDKEFSAIVLFHCFHEIELIKQGLVMKEMLRLLSDNGYILLLDTIASRITSYQKCFDLIHEHFFNYKHILGVQHAEWVIDNYISRGLVCETHNHTYKTNYHFDTLDSLCSDIESSFAFEMIWNNENLQLLRQMIINEFGEQEDYNLEEEIRVRLLKKVNTERL